MTWDRAKQGIGNLPQRVIEIIVGRWEAMIISINGKKIACLGPRRVGKTTLLRYMSTGEFIDSPYKQTILTEKVSNNLLRIGDKSLKLKKTRDVSGAPDDVNEWKKVYDESDLILYLVKGDSVDQAVIDGDFRKIADWEENARMSENNKRPPDLVVIVTHLDKDPMFLSTTPANQGDFKTDYVAKYLDIGISRLNHRPHIILGSLADSKRTELLVDELMKWMSNNED